MATLHRGPLERRFERISRIHEAIAILHWDQAVIMPAGSIESRAEQLATLGHLAHELLSSRETGDLLAAKILPADSGVLDRANQQLMQRAYDRATALDADFVAHRVRVCAHAEMGWRQARTETNYSIFQPHLEKVVQVVRETAIALSEALSLTPYDALLDEYQPGLREASFKPLFETLETSLSERVDAAIEANRPFSVQSRTITPAEQAVIFKLLMRQLGFDFHRGRLDESIHPFCGGVFSDHRITTRYDASDLTSGLMGILHETGHALYEAGLPEEWVSQPVGQSHGMLVHESQSLLIEMQICRSTAFLSFLSRVLTESFGEEEAWNERNLQNSYRHVERTLVRVDADEVTYPLHVIQRYRLERALLSGDLKPNELPMAWNDLMAKMLGVRPDNDRDGCLQDIHWSEGIFGYFPCYTLGALLAAQLAERLREDLGDLDQHLGLGDFKQIMSWLREHVHQYGSALELGDLIRTSSGKALGATAFLDHVDRRYLNTTQA